jgi:hypothetical protein
MVAYVEQVGALAASTFVTQLDKPATGQPPQTTPYALVHPADGIDEATRLTGPPVTEHPEFTIHIVGTTANQVKVVSDLLKHVLFPTGFGVTPTVTGRRCGKVFWRSPLPVQTDKNITPPLCFAVIEVGWRSDPA